jgi:para-nitrobenzyl esterase
MIAEHAGAHNEKLATILKRTSHPEVRRVMDRLGSRGDGFLCASKYIAGSMAQKNSNVFFYFFTRIRPGGEKILAYHGAEIPYALGTADDWLPGDKIDLQLSDTMMQYWVNFAATGSPNGAGLPEWPAYSIDDQNYLDLGDSISSETNLEVEICAILDQRRQEILTNMNER